MNDDELFRRLAAHAGSAEVDPGFDDRLYGLLRGEVGRSRRSTPTVLLIAAALLLALAVGSAILVGSGLMEPPVLPQRSTPRLAYEHHGDIYLADWDGGNPVQVADGADAAGGDAQCAGFGGEGSIWAPDGRHLAFRSQWGDECPGEVHVLDAEGRAVATVPGSGWDVSWSPDSTRFATWVDFSQTIGIYGIDGERQALLSVVGCRPDVADLDPVWSPDGASVLVRPCEYPIDGVTPRRLRSSDPRWGMSSTIGVVGYSPDGTRIARVYPRGDAGTDLEITEADGAVLQQVVPNDAPDAPVIIHDPVWSPAGDRVLFIQTAAERIEGSPAASEIREMDIATGRVLTLATAPEIWLIGFSPDGDRILYATRDNQAETEGLWSMEANGSHQRLLVPGTIRGEWRPLTDGNDR
jgi:Tol biopolymer transport system component